MESPLGGGSWLRCRCVRRHDAAGGRSGQRPRRADGRTARNRARAARRAAHAAAARATGQSGHPPLRRRLPGGQLRQAVCARGEPLRPSCRGDGLSPDPTRSGGGVRAGDCGRRPGRRTFLLRRHQGRRRQLDDCSSRRRSRAATGVGGPRAHLRKPRRARLRPGAKARRSCARRCLGIRQRGFRPHHRSRDGSHRPLGL